MTLPLDSSETKRRSTVAGRQLTKATWGGLRDTYHRPATEALSASAYSMIRHHKSESVQYRPYCILCCANLVLRVLCATV